MTGRDLIMYILSHNLEDEPIFKDGTFIGFMTVEQAAEKLRVGPASIYALVQLGKLDAVNMYNHILIADRKLLEDTNDKKELHSSEA